MENGYDSLKSIEMMFDNGIGMTFTREDGEVDCV